MTSPPLKANPNFLVEKVLHRPSLRYLKYSVKEYKIERGFGVRRDCLVVGAQLLMLLLHALTWFLCGVIWSRWRWDPRLPSFWSWLHRSMSWNCLRWGQVFPPKWSSGRPLRSLGWSWCIECHVHVPSVVVSLIVWIQISTPAAERRSQGIRQGSCFGDDRPAVATEYPPSPVGFLSIFGCDLRPFLDQEFSSMVKNGQRSNEFQTGFVCYLLLDAFSHLYRRVCPSVRRSHTSKIFEK